MSNAREPTDKTLINMGDPYEVNFWLARLEVTNEQLQRAIDRVGNNTVDVAVWLKKNADKMQKRPEPTVR